MVEFRTKLAPVDMWVWNKGTLQSPFTIVNLNLSAKLIKIISKTDDNCEKFSVTLHQIFQTIKNLPVWKLFMNVRKVKPWSTTWNWLLCLLMNVQNGWRHCSNGIKHCSLYIPIYERAEKRGKTVSAMPRRNYQSQRHLWMYWIIPSLLLNL